MAQKPQEAIMVYNTDGEICDEMLYDQFRQILAGNCKLDGYAASELKAAYCIVGDGLSLRGVVFFKFGVDENGVISRNFNLPLRYLAQNAGLAEDLGQGPVRKASRGQCPVPWHAVNLWEPPEEQGLAHVQSRIFRNKLKLKLTSGCKDEDFFSANSEVEIFDDATKSDIPPTNPGASAANLDVEDSLERNQVFAAKLTEVFGQAGKLSLQDLIRLHTDQLEEAKAKYRRDIEHQQLSYLDQLRSAREEIHELKVALRQEQGRNRRLQQMLRGDI